MVSSIVCEKGGAFYGMWDITSEPRGVLYCFRDLYIEFPRDADDYLVFRESILR